VAILLHLGGLFLREDDELPEQCLQPVLLAGVELVDQLLLDLADVPDPPLPDLVTGLGQSQHYRSPADRYFF
jgi:hypothetical protein